MQSPSPSFVLVNVYRSASRKVLYHLDAYRLSGPEEAIDLDVDDMLESGLWLSNGQTGSRLLCDYGLWVKMRWIDDDQRDLVFSAVGKRYQDILSASARKYSEFADAAGIRYFHPYVGIACMSGVQVLSEFSWTSRDNHSVELAPAVVEMMVKAGVKPNI